MTEDLKTRARKHIGGELGNGLADRIDELEILVGANENRWARELNERVYRIAALEAGAASRDAEVATLRELKQIYQTERDQLREQVRMLRDEVTRCRDWFETQAKVNSKGGPSSWELMLLRDERDAAEEALAATEPKI